MRQLAAATALPLNADFQNGYADDPEGVAANVALCVMAGAAGLSIEDATGDPSAPLYDAKLAVERVRTARAAWGGFVRAARSLAAEGSFAGLEGAASFAELNALFRTPPGPKE